MGHGYGSQVMASLALVALLALLMGCAAGTTGSGAQYAEGGFSSAGGGQVVMLGLKGSSYSPEEITVQAGRPVTLRNDGTIRGCAAFVVQPELGIRADFTRAQEYTFTPAKKGRFTYTCSMGMFRGVINVI